MPHFLASQSYQPPQGSFLGTKTTVRKRNPSQQENGAPGLCEKAFFFFFLAQEIFPPERDNVEVKQKRTHLPPPPRKGSTMPGSRGGGGAALTGGPKNHSWDQISAACTKTPCRNFAQLHKQLVLGKSICGLEKNPSKGLPRQGGTPPPTHTRGLLPQRARCLG